MRESPASHFSACVKGIAGDCLRLTNLHALCGSVSKSCCPGVLTNPFDLHDSFRRCDPIHFRHDRLHPGRRKVHFQKNFGNLASGFGVVLFNACHLRNNALRRDLSHHEMIKTGRESARRRLGVMHLDEQRKKRGAALKAARKAARFSADRLAEAVTQRSHGKWQATKETIYDIERGRRQLHDDLAKAIAQVMGVPEWTLLLGERSQCVTLQSPGPLPNANHRRSSTGLDNSTAQFAKRVEACRHRISRNQSFALPRN